MEPTRGEEMTDTPTETTVIVTLDDLFNRDPHDYTSDERKQLLAAYVERRGVYMDEEKKVRAGGKKGARVSMGKGMAKQVLATLDLDYKDLSIDIPLDFGETD
jgi:hypothetical protein